MRTILVVAAALFLAGCESLSYYGQAIGGHFKLMSQARPLDTWLTDPATPPELRYVNWATAGLGAVWGILLALEELFGPGRSERPTRRAAEGGTPFAPPPPQTWRGSAHISER